MQYVRTSHGESQVMCMAAIDDQLWCTCGSTVLLLDPRTLQVEVSDAPSESFDQMVFRYALIPEKFTATKFCPV